MLRDDLMEEKSKAKTHLSLIRAGHQVGLILYFFYIVRKARPEGRIRRDSSFLRFQSEVCVQHQRKGIQPPSIRIRITSKTAKKKYVRFVLNILPDSCVKDIRGTRCDLWVRASGAFDRTGAWFRARNAIGIETNACSFQNLEMPPKAT